MPSADVRLLVTESWMRSAAAGVSADQAEPPLALSDDVLRDYRESHPLARVLPLLEDVLGEAARASDALMALSDEHGQLLWVCGSMPTLRRAESIGFVEGASWDERVAGTNAPGTALTLGRPVQVTRAEHYLQSVRRWSCVAAPIQDPQTGAVLGVLDVTGGDQIAVPQTMGMVRAAARMAELELGRADATFTPGAGRRDIGGGVGQIHLNVLGHDEAPLVIDRRAVTLSRRHSEMMVLMVEAPQGFSGDEIACQLYESGNGDSTVRAELIRLRRVLGEDVLRSRPYRLAADARADWVSVEAALAADDVAGALRMYRGPVLPHSVAPGVVAVRERVHSNLARAVVASGRPDLLTTWTRQWWGAEDMTAWRALARSVSSASPVRRMAMAQLARLEGELA
ncbi:GAF domain-containing protein [Rudaeicoccus suwonensis]|nr:GAF domain-containing protein [Rudaeicoccus suwonensis]